MATRSPKENDSPRRRWPLLALAGAAALVIAAGFLILRAGDEPPRGARGQGSGRPFDQLHPTARPLDQAPWRIRVYLAGSVAKPAPRERARVKAQRKPLVDTVRALFDTRYFSPEAAARPVAKDTFTRSAARRWLAARSGPPQRLKRLRTVLRSARIGVDARTAGRAAAAVRIVARGRVDDRRALFSEEATLWLERERRQWHVIAFDTDRRQLPRHRKEKGKPKSGGKAGTSERKDRGKSSGGPSS